MKISVTLLILATLLTSFGIKLKTAAESPDNTKLVMSYTKEGSGSNIFVAIEDRINKDRKVQMELREDVSVSFEWLSNTKLNIIISDLGAILKADLGYEGLIINLIQSQ